MRLVLTSSGIQGKVTSNLKKMVGSLKNKKAAIVTSATPGSSAWLFVGEVEKELVGLGFKRGNIEVFTLEKRFKSSAFDKHDVVYSCGGNTFLIRDCMRKTGFDKAIRRFVERNGIYVGVSAGSIIAGPDITIAGWGSEGDPNDVHLKNMKGIGFCDIAVFPHYRPDLREEVDCFRKKVLYPIVELSDGQALFLWDDETKLVR
jgi:dipeptidase E